MTDDSSTHPKCWRSSSSPFKRLMTSRRDPLPTTTTGTLLTCVVVVVVVVPPSDVYSLCMSLWINISAVSAVSLVGFISNQGKRADNDDVSRVWNHQEERKKRRRKKKTRQGSSSNHFQLVPVDEFRPSSILCLAVERESTEAAAERLRCGLL